MYCRQSLNFQLQQLSCLVQQCSQRCVAYTRKPCKSALKPVKQAVTFSSRPLAVYAARYLQQLEHEVAGKPGVKGAELSGDERWKAILHAARLCQVLCHQPALPGSVSGNASRCLLACARSVLRHSFQAALARGLAEPTS